MFAVLDILFSEDRFVGKNIKILTWPRVVKTRQDNLCFPSWTYHIYGPQICCKRVDFEMLFSKFTRSRFYLMFTCKPWQHSACITDFTALNGLLCYRARNFDPHLITYFPWLTVTGDFKQEFIWAKQELAVGRPYVAISYMTKEKCLLFQLYLFKI